MNAKNNKLFNVFFYVGVTAFLLLCLVRLIDASGSYYYTVRGLLVGIIFLSYTAMYALVLASAKRKIETISLVILYVVFSLTFLMVLES